MPDERGMPEQSEHDQFVKKAWKAFLTGHPRTPFHTQRMLYTLFPSEKRCKLCKAPFQGIGALVAKLLYKKQPSKLNPLLCNICDDFARHNQGGAEVELSLLFIDIRDSTALAEKMTPTEFSQLINRFYNTTAQVMIRTDALIDKIIGDQASGFYVPGFAGSKHADRAVEAAQEIFQKVGYTKPEGPWISIGAGVHTGVAFVGSVGSEDGTTDITVLGDAPNTAARLCSNAQDGEILISDAAFQSAGLNLGDLEIRDLALKGKTEKIRVHVLNMAG